MKTIVIASRKGGSGKTTLTRNLAVALSHKGHRVLLVDVDSQGNLTDWWKDREKDDLQLVAIENGQLKAGLEQLKDLYDFVLIDSPPESNISLHPVIEVADYIFITCQASPDDLRSIGITASLVKSRGKPFSFVISQAKLNTRLYRMTQETLSELGNIAPVMREFEMYRLSAISGQTPIDVRKSCPASRDVRAITEYLLSQLEDMT